MAHHHEKEVQLLKGLAGDFLARESNRTSLITVTNVVISPDGKRVNILLSVLPREKERAAVEFANRRADDFRTYLKKHSKLRVLPFIRFAPDLGEQNRQRIEELLETE